MTSIQIKSSGKKSYLDLVAKTMAGLEDVLAEELKELGADDIRLLPRAVSFRGDKEIMYKANLCCRTALRILKPIAEFDVNDENKFYNAINNIEWEKYLSVNDTLAIDSILDKRHETQDTRFQTQDTRYATKEIRPASFSNSLYISQKAKDGIVDRFYNLYNLRPSVNLENPTLRINIHLKKEQGASSKYQDKYHCTVSMDSSGTSLHKRGYRQKTGIAPINEVLAAGLILLSGWKKDCNFIDPMCGSGTFLIEAAMMAHNIPPSYYRKEFGFMKWKDYDEKLWNKILKEALGNQKKFDYEIIGSDISETAIRTADENIRFAKLQKDIRLQVSSFAELNVSNDKGFLIMNPPYGERLKEEKIIELYKSMGDILKRKYAGYKAWIISSDIEALKFIGLKPSKKIKIYNGPLECRFVKFEVYEGSRKSIKN